MLHRLSKVILLTSFVFAYLVAVAGAQEIAKSDGVDSGSGDKRYDVQPVTMGTVGLAILIDHQTGKAWVLTPAGGSFVSGNFKWTNIPFAAPQPSQ